MIGYVIMPEHFHFMISEPEKGDPWVVMKMLKQTVARRLLPQGSDILGRSAFTTSNVFSEEKFIEKLGYMLRNPVKRGLVDAPEDLHWSSYRTYAFEERGRVKMDWYFPPYTMRSLPVQQFGQHEVKTPTHRTSR
jgi:hypothetical protein